MNIIRCVGIGLMLSSSTAFAGLDGSFVANKPTEGPESCSYIDLRSTCPKIRDQKDLSWCYAFTAADVMSQALHQENASLYTSDKGRYLGAHATVSAEQMAWEYQKTNGGSLLKSQDDGGQIAKALNAAIDDTKYCTEEELNSDGGKNNANLQLLADARHSIAQDLKASGDNYSSDDLGREFSQQLIDQSCHSTAAKMTVHDLKGRRWGGQASDADLLAEINRALTSKRIAGISYSATFLLKNVSNPDTGTDGHASSIVGRQWKNGKCQYMLRNSWGSDCSYYPKPLDKQCSGGVVYVDQDFLRQALWGVTTIPAEIKTDNLRPATPGLHQDHYQRPDPNLQNSDTSS